MAGKLTDNDVIYARRMYRDEVFTIKHLAKRFGVSRRTMEMAIHGNSFQHIPDPVPAYPNSIWLEGEKTPLAKLTEEQVLEIRRLRNSTSRPSYDQLADQFKISPETIAKICQGKHWKHLLLENQTQDTIRAQIPAARARAIREEKQPWWPIAARYDAMHHGVIVTLRSGCSMIFPRDLLKELAGVPVQQLEALVLMHDALHWEDLNVDISVPGLITMAIGTNMLVTDPSRQDASARTDAKAKRAKSRRPRKNPSSKQKQSR